MKYLVLIGDGMADFPLENHGGKTPLELASTPAMDELAQSGITGMFWPIPDGYAPGSDIGNLSLFGYDPATTFTGRAPLEAANQGIPLGEGDVAFRCNLVTLGEGMMQSFTSGHITSEEGAALITAVNEAALGGDIEFHPGVGYRHLAIFADPAIGSDALVATECTPPHNISDQDFAPSLPQGPAGDLLRSMMVRSMGVLAAHPVNKARVEQGKLPATSIWLWGQGCAPSMDTYQDRFGLTGAVVSAVDLVQGIGRCAGMRVLKVPGATGYLDTNYAGKVDAALSALDEVDFVYLHVEAPDEASHEGRTDLKVQAIEDFDRKVVAPCLAYAQGRGDCRVLVAPDHVTAISTKTHAGGPVPFALCGADVAANGAAGYSEKYADATGVQVRQGHALVPAMLQCAKLGAHSL